jgi:hypothetical protein
MGPAAARISSELQQAVDKLAPLPGHIADPARVRAMLAHVAKTLFVGVLNDCFFDPATALCLNGKAKAAMPAMAQCRPDRCPNSCIASHHRPLWAKAIADGEALLKTRRLSPLQQKAIEVDLKRYRNVLRPAKDSRSGPRSRQNGDGASPSNSSRNHCGAEDFRPVPKPAVPGGV